MENATINSIFKDMFFSYGYGLDMKTEDKGPKKRAPGEGKGVKGNAGSRQGFRARKSCPVCYYELQINPERVS